MKATRPFYWSVRRELWENRAIYLGPVLVEAVFLLAFLVTTIVLRQRMIAGLTLDGGKYREMLTKPFSAAAFLMIVTAFLVGAFYCLDALHGERRDRSILFWKSLPVSDRTTVLAKASIPLVVLPMLIFAIVAAAYAVMLLLTSAALLGSSRALANLWANVHLTQTLLAFLYALVAMALWYAPIYGWLLLVSAWARRAPVLWALLPPLAISAVEAILVGSSHFMTALGFRMTGWLKQAFVFPLLNSKGAVEPLANLAPARFLGTPGLWLGLAFAAACVAAAVRLRRNREPI